MGKTCISHTMPRFAAYYVELNITTLMGYSGVVIREFQNKGFSEIHEISDDDFDIVWKYFLKRNQKGPSALVSKLREYLRCKKIIKPCRVVKTPAFKEWKAFEKYLQHVVGLEKSTISSYHLYLRQFWTFIGLNENKNAVQQLKIETIDAFLIQGCNHFSRYMKRYIIGHLRRYLSYLYFNKRISSPLHKMLYGPKIYKKEKLPKALPWKTVMQLCSSIDRTTQLGKRDYAIMMLGTNYGLRDKEIAGLLLDDINWREKSIKIRQPKTKNEIRHPLTDAVACALIDYLQNGRPMNLRSRHVFLRKLAPHNPFRHNIITDTLKRAVKHSGLQVPFKNAHCLRHSFAMYMIAKQKSIKVIGDLLGHHNPDSTATYIRLAVDDMRCVPLDYPQPPRTWVNRPSINIKNIPRRRDYLPQKLNWEFTSFLAVQIKKYITLKNSFGIVFRNQERALRLFDHFLKNSTANKIVNQEIFDNWICSLDNISAATRALRIHSVINFFKYLRREQSDCFCLDASMYIAMSRKRIAHILTPEEVGKILVETQSLFINHNEYQYKPMVVRMAIAIAYTCGLRISEACNIKREDIDLNNETLLISKTKFHKQRVIPLAKSVVSELKNYFITLNGHGIIFTPDMPVFLSYARCIENRPVDGSTIRNNFKKLCALLGIVTKSGYLPRFHDLRHSLAVNSLIKAYEQKLDLNAFLPLLSSYMGHVSINNTSYYLSLVEPLRIAVNDKFEKTYGNLG